MPVASFHPSTRLNLRLKLALVGGLAALLQACASYGDLHPKSQLQDPAQLGAQPPKGAALVWPATQWWQRYGDAALDQVMSTALQGNPGIKQAAARWRAALAAAGVEQAQDGVQLNLVGHSNRELFSRNYLYPPPYGGGIYSDNVLHLQLDKELDFWGRQQAGIAAALSRADAAAADEQAARLMLSSAVAKLWFQLAANVQQERLQDMQLEQLGRLAQLLEQRVSAGLEDRQAMLQAQAERADAQRQGERLGEQSSLLRNALAALANVPAAQYATLSPAWHSPQALPQLGADALQAVPIDIAGHRPDLTAARARVLAASAQGEQAKAAFYPNVRLSAFLGLASLNLSKWFEGNSQEWSAGPALSLPIFDAGRLRANLRARQAELDAAVENYNQTLGEAIHEIADLLTSTSATQRQSQTQQQSLELAQRQLDLAQQRQQQGVSNALSVIQARRAQLAQQRERVTLDQRTLELDVSLMKALGGGYLAPASNQQTSNTTSNTSSNTSTLPNTPTTALLP